jgi:hypothetical protein
MSVDTSEGNENMDYAQHQRTYDVFIILVKSASVAVIGTLILMAIFLL